MKRAYKRLLFFFISLIVVMLSGAVGYIVARQEPRIVEAEPSPDVVEAGANDARIEKGATFTWIYDYDMCRHTESFTTEADKSMVGLSFTQLQQQIPEVKIVSFDTDAVVLQKELLCYCPQHFILKKKGESLSVFRTKSGTEEQEKLREFNFSLDKIDDAEQKSLEAGRVFADIKEVERYVYKLMLD